MIRRDDPHHNRYRGSTLTRTLPALAGQLAPSDALTVRAEELTAPPSGVTRAYIVENEVTFLAFPLDPDAMVFQIEAWLPQRIAIVKIRGFVHDSGGDVVESGPGLIRVRVGARERPANAGYFAFTRGAARRGTPMEMELRLQQVQEDKDNKLCVTVVFHPPTRAALHDFQWRERCNQVFCEVRSYLMGSSHG